MIVVDASVLVDFLLDQPAAVQLVEEAFADDSSDLFHAPELIQLESIQTLRRLTRQAVIDHDTATDAISAMKSGRLVHHSIDPLTDRIWELRHNLTAYDASYLALAEALDDPLLLTGDRGLADAAVRSLGSEHVRYVA